ncbi:hypothetical protein PR048_021328 [Dryococelus australis]|uniref:Uncharacterized protein n=1 Tax=Dryococelus australis TaxID=614101 RepID=A0ABQ9GXW5_9NEOP|nr:hypothetical protein PR048_021328 [Dryococelus australis]
MDDHNGECFEHHEELFASINTSDSEHECLKEFLLEPDDVSRSVPCSADSSDVINSFIGIGNHVGNEVGVKPLGVDQQNVFQNTLKLPNQLDNNIPLNNFSSLVNSHGSVDTCASTNTGFSLSAETSVDGLRSSGQSPCVNFNSVGENIPHLPGNALLGDQTVNYLPQQLTYGNNSIPECEGASSSDCVSPNFSTKNINDDDSDEHETHENVLSSGRSGSGGRGRGAGRGRKRKVASESSRGRAASVKKRKQQVTTYQSQISPDQNGIKLRIKMSSTTASVPPTRRKERSKKRKSRRNSSTDDEGSGSESNTSRWLPEHESTEVAERHREQSVWGEKLPPHLLERIFMLLTYEEGCMPFLLR